MYKLRRKLRDAKVYPLEDQILKSLWSMSFYGQFRPFFYKSWPTLSKPIFLNLIFCFLL